MKTPRIITNARGILAALFLAGVALPVCVPCSAAEPANAPSTVEEARARARLLHETIHGALQVMHRDFFNPDDRNRIPSATLEDVFKVLSETWQVQVHWLGVNARTMDADHEPQDEFERNAVKALATGTPEYEAVEGNRYRFAGSIQLHNSCLKCHVPNRTTLEDRFAGLLINMPLAAKP